MKTLGGTWGEADILGFIAGPRTFLPDTKMTFAGLKNDKDRADVLAYLLTLKD
jgi:cytochrome c